MAMRREKLVIWGASGHAMVVADIVRLRGDYEIAGFLDSVNPERAGGLFCGARILGGEEQLDLLSTQGVSHFIMGFGDCAARLKLGALVTSKGFELATAVHPGSIVSPDVRIHAGTVVVGGAVVNPGSRIGENVIINTGATVGHECTIGDGAHICPGVHLAGRVRVGQGAWVGLGACVVESLSIGAGAYIGAGAVVVRSVPDGMVAYGNPARVRRVAP